MRARVLALVCACASVRVCERVCVRERVCACASVRVSEREHVHIHAYMHMLTCVRTGVYILCVLLLFFWGGLLT